MLPPGRFARFRGLGAALLALAGFAALVYGLFGSGLGTTEILVWMGLGALLIFFGVALFSSRLVRPLARVLGWPAHGSAAPPGGSRATTRGATRSERAPPRPRS